MPPSAIVRDLDPRSNARSCAACRPIRRERPSIGAGVAAALPGGDPLAAALAAGETPSPEMVAAAGSDEALQRDAAVAGGAWVVLVAARAPGHVPARPAGQSCPDAEAARGARGSRAGGAGTPRLQANVARSGVRHHAVARLRALHRRDIDAIRSLEQAAIDRPESVVFWYRTSPRPLIPLGIENDRAGLNPPLNVSGMTLTVVDASGRLGRVPRRARARPSRPPPQNADRLAAAVRGGRPADHAVRERRAKVVPARLRRRADGVGRTASRAAGPDRSCRSGGVARATGVLRGHGAVEPLVPIRTGPAVGFNRMLVGRRPALSCRRLMVLGALLARAQLAARTRRSSRGVPRGVNPVCDDARGVVARSDACERRGRGDRPDLRRDRQGALRRRGDLADVSGARTLHASLFAEQPDRLDANDRRPVEGPIRRLVMCWSASPPAWR